MSEDYKNVVFLKVDVDDAQVSYLMSFFLKQLFLYWSEVIEEKIDWSAGL